MDPTTTPARPEVVPGDRRPSRWRLGAPFTAVHLSCLLVVLVGWSPLALVVAGVLYVSRAFGITGFYHRCFAHRAFRVPRAVQFAGALLGASAAQQGPLWWVGHHREHHRYTDRPGDPHSPVTGGFWWSHVAWIFHPENVRTRIERVRDLAVFPELRLLDRFHHVAPVSLGVVTFGAGMVLKEAFPWLHTSGPQLAVWAAISTVALYHSTFAVNSVAHRFGSRPYDTRDESRNNWWVSALTIGEGWHNNHHRFPNSARQGWRRWQFDPTWMGIRAMAALGLATALRPVPAAVLTRGSGRLPASRPGMTLQPRGAGTPDPLASVSTTARTDRPSEPVP